MTIRTFCGVTALMLPLTFSAMACGESHQSTTTPSSLASGTNGATSAERHGAPSNGTTNNATEVKGSVHSVAGMCPALRLTVAGRTITTTASTQFSDGPCRDVRVGSVVEVKGTVQADGSVAATRLELRGVADDNGPDDRDDEADNRDEISGTIANRAGSCPALTFVIATTPVRTDGRTSFHDIACTALANGIAVEVKGQRQNDGTLLASRVERRED